MAQDIIWLVPNKPENISTGRQRIADGLRERGFSVILTDDRKTALRKTVSEKPDVLMTTTAAGGLVGPPTKITGTKYVVDYVDPILQMYHSSNYVDARLATTLQHFAFTVADGILYVYEEESLRVNRFETPIQKTTLGVDYDKFANPVADSVRQANEVLQRCTNRIPNDFAIYIGGLESIYNIDALIQSAEDHGFELVIAGTGEYSGLVSDAAVRSGNIHYLGVIEHELIPGLLSKANCGICLVDDPHTVKVLEYGAAGLPIVHLEGRAEPVLPNSGVHFTSDESDEIARTVDSANKTTDTTQLQDYAQRHDYERVIDDYESVLETVCE